MTEQDNPPVGYTSPPKNTRFKKGKSGNPKGRPKKQEDINTLLQKVLKRKIRLKGAERKIPIREALIRKLRDLALSGDQRAISLQRRIIEEAGCLHRAIDGSRDVLSSVTFKAGFWERAATVSLNDRQIKVLNRMLDGFEGKMTSSKWAKIGKCSQDSANRDIAPLLKLGLLERGPGGGRSTHYIVAQATELP